MIITILISILGLVIIGVFCYKRYKKSEDELEKILYLLAIAVYIIPVSIFYLDRYNIPTRLGWNQNINTQNWLAFLSSYLSGVVSAIIGAIVLVIVTILQIRKNNEDTRKRDMENIRLQNMPIIKYELNTYELMIPKPQEIKTKFDSNNTYSIYIKLKNIGLNVIKSIKIDFDSEINNNRILRLKGKNTQVAVEKGQEIQIHKCFNLEEKDSTYVMKFIVYYQDVLNNWYKQTVEIDYKATGKATVGGYIGDINYTISKEEIIENEVEN